MRISPLCQRYGAEANPDQAQGPNLAVETGRHRETWLPKKDRTCGHCQTEKAETEKHLLLHCEKYTEIIFVHLKTSTKL